MLKIVNKGAKSNLPFSPAIIAGDLMFVSGQASVDSEIGTIISGTFEEEMRRSIENLRSILVAEGLSLDNVINIKSYVAQQSDLPLYNKIYAEYFAVKIKWEIVEGYFHEIYCDAVIAIHEERLKTLPSSFF